MKNYNINLCYNTMKFKKPTFPKIKKETLYTGIALINPLVGAGLLIKNESDKDPEKFKSTIKSKI